MGDILKNAMTAISGSFSGDYSSSGRRSGMCDFCGQNPKNPGFDYCSKRCGVDAAKQATALAPSGGRGGYNRQQGTAWASSAGPGQGRSDSNLCENCHQRPKREEIDHRGAKITHPYCGRTCANEARTARCRLRDCNKTTNGDPYCSDSHAKKAVRNGEASACPSCKEMPVNPGFTFCSKKCALRAGGGGGGGGDGGSGLSPLNLLDDGASDAYEAVQRFTKAWTTAPPTRPQVHAVYNIALPKSYEKRFTEAMQRADSIGGKNIYTTYYGGQCICDIGVNVTSHPPLCQWPGCSICAVLRNSFDILEFNTPTHNGLYGEGIYTNVNPAHSNKFTVGKSTNPYRALILCSVVGLAVQVKDKKINVIGDEQGRVFIQNKDLILPKQLIIYKP